VAETIYEQGNLTGHEAVRDGGTMAFGDEAYDERTTTCEQCLALGLAMLKGSVSASIAVWE
jgi:hypothetical protein